MYQSFYNLNKKPFQISSDPAFMWFGEKHKEALATLRYGILDNKGFLLLTGDVGTGKTTLINALVQNLSEDVICTSVPDPGLEKLDFFNFIAASFGINREFSTKGSFLVHFRKFLIEANKNHKKVLLIIDEAQLLTQEMLEEIRLLSNIEKTDTKLINIFFIGQNEFNEIVNQEQNRAVRQRLTLNYNIDPLTPDETGEYIKHRLAISGATYSIFDDSATQEVFMYSGGFPRRINVICDHCLLSGYVKEQKTINNIIVKECAKELKIPAHIKNRDINGFAGYGEQSAPVIPDPVQRPLPVKQKIQKKNRWGTFFLKGIIFSAFIIFVFWFLLFPDNFNKKMAGINKNALELKNKAVQIITHGDIFFQEKKTKTIPLKIKKKHPLHKEIEIKKEKKQLIINDPLVIEKTVPVQEKLINEDETRHIIPSMDEILLKENITEKNPIEIKKKVSPLPDKKVIVRFKYNTNDFTQEGFNNLIKFADILNQHPEVKILITGYTDSEGYKKYNRKLSEFRANIVKSFLLGRGLNPDRVEIKGSGSKNPMESNDTAWGRMMNRRVEIEIVK